MTDTSEVSPVTIGFEAHEVDSTSFHHADHVRVAFDLLRKYDFLDAAAIYAKGIRAIAAKAGAPRKFNLTITCAFLSVIAERLAAQPVCDFEAFVSHNPDLMSRNLLLRWYASERLGSDMAREIFLLPDAATKAA